MFKTVGILGEKPNVPSVIFCSERKERKMCTMVAKVGGRGIGDESRVRLLEIHCSYRDIYNRNPFLD